MSDFHFFRLKYQESSIRFEKLAYLHSFENKCNLATVSRLFAIKSDVNFPFYKL